MRDSSAVRILKAGLMSCASIPRSANGTCSFMPSATIRAAVSRCLAIDGSTRTRYQSSSATAS